MIEFTNMRAAGFLHGFFSEDSLDSPLTQFAHAYVGGLHPFEGFDVVKRKNGAYELRYPGDPPMVEISRATLHGWTLSLFDYGWLLFLSPDGNQTIVRAD